MSRSGEHYMPRPDAEFSMWANHYASAVAAFYDAQGLDPAGLAPLDEALAAWNEAFPAHVTAQAAAQAARRAKDAARAALERRVRPVTAFVQAWGGTTNADRAEMGIAVRPAKGSPAPAPVTRPRALVDVAQRLTHRLRLVDESTPTRRARPAGVQRAELFVALTEPGRPAPPPPNPDAADGGSYRYMGSLTRGETTLTFRPENGGLQAHYLSRWVSTNGATGPWSETTSATVAA